MLKDAVANKYVPKSAGEVFINPAILELFLPSIASPTRYVMLRLVHTEIKNELGC